MTNKACRNCHYISNGPICPNCKSTNLSDDWSGLVIIIDPTSSNIAGVMGIKAAGKYALKVR